MQHGQVEAECLELLGQRATLREHFLWDAGEDQEQRGEEATPLSPPHGAREGTGEGGGCGGEQQHPAGAQEVRGEGGVDTGCQHHLAA